MLKAAPSMCIVYSLLLTTTNPFCVTSVVYYLITNITGTKNMQQGEMPSQVSRKFTIYVKQQHTKTVVNKNYNTKKKIKNIVSDLWHTC